jgi:zinc protease
MSVHRTPHVDRLPMSFTDGIPQLAVDRFTLPSGLEVIVHPDPSLPQVAVSTWYYVGAGDEPAGSSGRAHLFEHLFKNSAHLAGRHHYDILRGIGASDANASTGVDRTAYHQVVPAHQLEVALWLESDRMGYFLPAMTQARLEAQQQVVRSERRQRYENVPYGAERFAMAAAMYAPDHPLHHLVIGSHEHIAANTLDDIAGFYRTWYVPANAHLVLAGAVDVDETRRLIDRYFGSFPASRTPPRRAVDPAASVGTRPAAMTQRLPDRFATMERLHFAWTGPVAHGDDGTALEVLAAAWAAPGTGALWKRLVYREQLAQRVSTWLVNHRLGSELHVSIDLRGGIAAERVAGAFDEELAAVAAAPFDAAAIGRVVGRREAGVLWGLQSIARRAADLQRHLLWHGEPNGFAAEAARFRTVTPASVQRAAATWLTDAHRLTIHTEPRAEASGRGAYARARTVDRSAESESDEPVGL